MTELNALHVASQRSYEVHTPVFEGPLALLLRLIEKKELDITNVALAQVTDDFMDHVDRLRANMEIESIADFLTVAAKLLWIKSQALLPKPPASTAEEDTEDDIGDELIRQLRAYRQYRDAAAWLRERDEAGRRSYVRARYPARPKHVSVDLSQITLASLRHAAEEALFPTQMPRPEDAIQRPRLSIVQQISLIHRRLKRWTRVSFQRLLSDAPSRVEVVVTLQAVLELMKQQVIAARQEELFGDITIQAVVPLDQRSMPGTGQESQSAPLAP